MRRADERRVGITVIERSPHLLDEPDQRGVGHMAVGPELLVQLLLGQHARGLADQQRQQLERLGREVPDAVIAAQLSARRVEHEGPEPQDHDAPQIPRDFPRHAHDFE